MSILTQIGTGGIKDNAVTTPKLNDAAVTTPKIDDGDVTTAKLADSAVTLSKTSGIETPKNILINGNMSVWQRATSKTGFTNDDHATVDRYRTTIDSLGTWAQTQSTDVPSGAGTGFPYSLKMDCTTADASPAAADRIYFEQRLEGNAVQHLKKGTADAVSVTLSFWVKSSKTGTYIIRIQDNDNTRSICKSYTINSANTWEKKELTFGADSTGTLDNDNQFSLGVQWWLGAGSDYTSGTLQTSWDADTNANLAVGQVNLGDSTSNEWYLTGCQLEVGTVANNFAFESYDETFQKCQRYCQKITRFQFYFYHFWDGNNVKGDTVGVYTSPLRATPGTFNVVNASRANSVLVQMNRFSGSYHLRNFYNTPNGWSQFVSDSYVNNIVLEAEI